MWNYYRHELTDETNDDNSPNKNAINSKSFEYKTSITGSTYNVDDDDLINYGPDMCDKIQNFDIAGSLKNLGNFWRTLDIPLINCEVSLTLTWSANCVITSMEKRLVTAVQGDNPAVYHTSPIGATFTVYNKRHKIVCSSSYFIS